MIIGDKMKKFKIKFPTKTRSFVTSGYGYIGRRVRFIKFKRGKSKYVGHVFLKATIVGEDFRHPLYSGQTTRVCNQTQDEIEFGIDVKEKLLFMNAGEYRFVDNRDLWHKIARMGDPPIKRGNLEKFKYGFA